MSRSFLPETIPKKNKKKIATPAAKTAKVIKQNGINQ